MLYEAPALGAWPLYNRVRHSAAVECGGSANPQQAPVDQRRLVVEGRMYRVSRYSFDCLTRVMTT